jgi:hypothetical protein
MKTVIWTFITCGVLALIVGSAFRDQSDQRFASASPARSTSATPPTIEQLLNEPTTRSMDGAAVEAAKHHIKEYAIGRIGHYSVGEIAIAGDLAVNCFKILGTAATIGGQTAKGVYLAGVYKLRERPMLPTLGRAIYGAPHPLGE